MALIRYSSAEKYGLIVNNFVERFRDEKRIPANTAFDWNEFSKWAIIHAESKKYSLSYKRIIRAALLFALSSLKEEQITEGMKAVKEWDPIEEETMEGQYDEENQTPTRTKMRERARMIPKEDWSALINYFNTQRSLSNARAQAMLAAGVGCGARPIEWINARLIGNNVIRIYTAKVKNTNAWDRVKPMVFTEAEYDDPEKLLEELKETEVIEDTIENAIFENRIKQSGLDPEKDADLINELRVNRKGANNNIFRDVMFEDEFKIPIELNLRYIDEFFRSKFGDNWRDVEQNTLEKAYLREYYNNVRIAVWRACRRLFGKEKIYSPADTRSTFSANRKAKFGLKQTSVDLGHTNTTMTRAHYAPASKAWK